MENGCGGDDWGDCRIYESIHDTVLPCFSLHVVSQSQVILPASVPHEDNYWGNKVLIMFEGCLGISAWQCILSFALHNSCMFELRRRTRHVYSLHWGIQRKPWRKPYICIHVCTMQKWPSLWLQAVITQAEWSIHSTGQTCWGWHGLRCRIRADSCIGLVKGSPDIMLSSTSDRLWHLQNSKHPAAHYTFAF